MDRPVVGDGRFLLIDERGDQLWRRALAEALESLGQLFFSDVREAFELVSNQDFDLVIIDASEVENIPLVVGRIRAQRPGTKIVVATGSPTWRRAREALRAGATDYIRNSLDRKTLKKTLQAIMEKTPPADIKCRPGGGDE